MKHPEPLLAASINNSSSARDVDATLLAGLLDFAYASRRKKPACLDLLIVDDREIAALNRRHLRRDGPARRAGDELAFQARYAGADADGIAAAVDLLALTPLLDLEVRQLSAGQKRRLALARLIAAPRPLWLLDEPLSPLDARWRAVMGTLIQAHVDKGGAVIAAVHDPLPVPARTLDLGGGR